jgi:hypothetical protein
MIVIWTASIKRFRYGPAVVERACAPGISKKTATENYAGIDLLLESADVSVMDKAGRRERKAGKQEMRSKT